MAPLALAGRILLAVVFGVAGGAKLADRPGTRSALEDFGLSALAARVGASTLPLVELAVAVGLLVPASASWSALAALGLLVAFTVGLSISLARGREPDCHCFGQVHSSPVGWRTLARNACLAGVAAAVVLAGRSESPLSPVGWLAQLTATELVFGGVAVALAVLAGVQGWFLLQLLHQNGRILARLETLEAEPRMPEAEPRSPRGSDALPAQPHGAEANGNGRAAGLPVGASAPGFALRALDGEQVSLEGLCSSGRPVLLVFSDPGCAPCNALLPSVRDWRQRHAHQLTIALISRGPAEASAAKAHKAGLSELLLPDGGEVAGAYRAHGTPSAVLVVDGKVASALALGPDAIAALVDATTGSTPGVPLLSSRPLDLVEAQ